MSNIEYPCCCVCGDPRSILSLTSLFFLQNRSMQCSLLKSRVQFHQICSLSHLNRADDFVCSIRTHCVLFGLCSTKLWLIDSDCQNSFAHVYTLSISTTFAVCLPEFIFYTLKYALVFAITPRIYIVVINFAIIQLLYIEFC